MAYWIGWGKFYIEMTNSAGAKHNRSFTDAGISVFEKQGDSWSRKVVAETYSYGQ